MTSPALVSARVVFVDMDGRLTRDGLLILGSLNNAVPSYTVASVPSAASSGQGAIIFVSNEAGGAVLAFSDATNWRRVTDRAIIS